MWRRGGGSGASVRGCVLLCEWVSERVSDEAARAGSGCMRACCSQPVCCSACSLRPPSIPIADKMYWTDQGTNKIQRASLDGSNVEDLVASGLIAPVGIALETGRRCGAHAHPGTCTHARLHGLAPALSSVCASAKLLLLAASLHLPRRCACLQRRRPLWSRAAAQTVLRLQQPPTSHSRALCGLGIW